MKASTLTLAVSLISLFLVSGCSMNRADSLRMLDTRAEYDDPRLAQELMMREAGIEGFQNGPVPVRSRPKLAAIWIHPHEMASHDYFWGGWMSVVVESDQWVLSKPGELPRAPGIVDVTKAKSSKPKVRVPGTRPKLKK